MGNEIIRAVDPEGVGPIRLLDFFSPDAVSEAMAEANWDAQEMIEQLAEIARDATNNTARERMAAMKMLTDQGKEALVLHGHIRKITAEATQEEGGIKKTLTADSLELLRAGSARMMTTLELLAAGQSTPEIIDVDTDGETPLSLLKEDSSDSTTGRDVQSGVVGRGPGGAGGGIRGGPVQGSPVHGSERPDSTSSQASPQGDNKEAIKGAKDNEQKGIPNSTGSGRPSQGPGGPNGGHQREHREAGQHSNTGHCSETGAKDPPDSNPPGGVAPRTTPYTPGSARRRARRASTSDSDNGSPTGGVPEDVGTTRPADGADDGDWASRG